MTRCRLSDPESRSTEQNPGHEGARPYLISPGSVTGTYAFPYFTAARSFTENQRNEIHFLVVWLVNRTCCQANIFHAK